MIKYNRALTLAEQFRRLNANEIYQQQMLTQMQQQQNPNWNNNIAISPPTTENSALQQTQTE
jgi:hypothetical protein